MAGQTRSSDIDGKLSSQTIEVVMCADVIDLNININNQVCDSMHVTYLVRHIATSLPTVIFCN